ncbi:MAG TPA: hypothetical protein VJP87_07010 [Candidatus Acidoferrales bacterium]|nr:hypothetical protein [Candidatus Acidoferrales bacterium]
MPYRYAVLRSLCDGASTQLKECDDLQTAKAHTENCARKERGYFYVVDRETKSVVYVYSLKATKDAENKESPYS